MTNTTDPIALLSKARRIAVVSCSATPGKDAHEIPKLLLAQGYEILPVNPTAGEIFGRPAYKSLAEVPGPIDIVNVFRPAAEAPAIAKDAAAVGAKAVWLQTGLESAEARRLAEGAGMAYVENTCIRVVQGYVNATKR